VKNLVSGIIYFGNLSLDQDNFKYEAFLST